MTGKEWDTYFKSLPKDKLNKLAEALHILDNDPIFRSEPTLGSLVPSGGS